MRLTSVFQVVCECGEQVEFPDSLRETTCPTCGRLLVVVAWPNEPPMTIEAKNGKGVNGR